MDGYAARVIECCRRLATFTETPGMTTRTFLSAPMRDVHAHLTWWMQAAGMRTRIDSAGNLRGTYGAVRRDAPTFILASHLDTVPNAGAFDGVLGAAAAIAIVDSLGGEPLPFNLEVIGFSEEEGVRFGAPFIGSLALIGAADEQLLSRRDANGCTVADAIRAFGLDPRRIEDARAEGPLIGYLELHSEQGPVLERLAAPVGIVDTIVGQTRVSVTFAGTAGHAGTTPMAERRDAVAGAAQWIGVVEGLARATPDLVATVGCITVDPSACNVIAGRCALTLDVRHPQDSTRRAAADRLAASARAVAAARGLDVTWAVYMDQPAVAMDPGLVAALERAVSRARVPVHRLASGAGHDAMIAARRMPAAMLFLRAPGGVSHHPDEAVIDEDVATSLVVARHLLDELALQMSRPRTAAHRRRSSSAA